MIRRQRSAHAAIWTGLAVALPIAFLVSLALAPGPSPEREPLRLDPPAGKDAAP